VVHATLDVFIDRDEDSGEFVEQLVRQICKKGGLKSDTI
jgi:hypothetical protein